MPLINYTPERTFAPATRLVIEQANQILAAYAAQGYDLTLRQLYYQFVARDLVPNNDRSYKRLGSIVNDARLAGMIDWNSIVDRTRNLRETQSWENPQSIIDASAAGFKLDPWPTQSTYVEAWVEKDALIGVLQRACRPLRVPYFSCRGYVSQSEMWRAARRIGKRINSGQRVCVLHLGDHDPSGVDMSRDIRDRIMEFLVGDGHYLYEGEQEEGFFELRRIALTWDQIEEYGPPPNPAKITDSRSTSYIERYGDESWELDALEPTVIGALIEEHTLGLRDNDEWEDVMQQEERHRNDLTAVSERWDEVVEFVS